MADADTLPHALVVLHDVPGACLGGLERFITTARERGMELVADLPPSCVPVHEGRIVGDLAAIVTP